MFWREVNKGKKKDELCEIERDGITYEDNESIKKEIEDYFEKLLEKPVRSEKDWNDFKLTHMIPKQEYNTSSIYD